MTPPVYGIAYRVSQEERLLLHPITFDSEKEAQEAAERIGKKFVEMKSLVFICEEPKLNGNNHDEKDQSGNKEAPGESR